MSIPAPVPGPNSIDMREVNSPEYKERCRQLEKEAILNATVALEHISAALLRVSKLPEDSLWHKGVLHGRLQEALRVLAGCIAYNKIQVVEKENT